MVKKAQKVDDFNRDEILRLLAIIPQIRWFDESPITNDIQKDDYLTTMKLMGELLGRLCHPMQVIGSPKRESLATGQAYALTYMLRHVVPHVSVEEADDISFIDSAIKHGCEVLTKLIEKDL